MTAVPDLSQAFALRDEDVRAYREQGHVVLRGLASLQELAHFRPALLEAGEAARSDHRPLAERDTYGKAFIQMSNLWRHNDVARAFVFARRFARVAAELMGVSGVRLYHDQALFSRLEVHADGLVGTDSRPCGASKSSSGPAGTTPVGLMLVWLR